MSVGTLAYSLRFLRTGTVLATLAITAGGCSQVGSNLSALRPLSSSDTETASFPGQTDLHKATAQSQKQFNPRDAKSVVAHARNLKALGDKQGALMVLQRGAEHHADNRELASEYGRLALEFDQVALAAKLLAIADDPVRPDWRILSARGTVLAKQSRYPEAVQFFERAQALDPGNPTIVNNLAMALAAKGEAGRAEGLLRQALASRPGDLRIRANLGVVAQLQGKSPDAVLPVASPPVAAVAPPTVAAPRSQPEPVRTAAQSAPVAAHAPMPSSPPARAQTSNPAAAAFASRPAVVEPVRAGSLPAATEGRQAATTAAVPAPTAWHTTTSSAPVESASTGAAAPRAPAVAGWAMDVQAVQPSDTGAPVSRATVSGAPVSAVQTLVPPNPTAIDDLPSSYWRPVRRP